MENTFEKEKKIYEDILASVSKVIVGKEEVITRCLIALVAGGHVLLEDVPGTGKTMLARAISASLDLTSRRVQFTPDLLPGDVTGINIWQPSEGSFKFTPGPVFTDILLADEINRATPRTQAGLLECMEERQVTTDGVTRPLSPMFFVMATQNPIESSGTFPLPEAQLDRFLMKLSMGFPHEDEERRILRRFNGNDVLSSLQSVADEDDILAMRESMSRVKVSDILVDYIVRLCTATRRRTDVSSGSSPRGSLALMRCSQILAMFRGRDYVVPEDIKELACDVLSHRIILPDRFGFAGENRRIIGEILDSVAVPTEDFADSEKDSAQSGDQSWQ